MKTDIEIIASKIHDLWTVWAENILETEPHISQERVNRWQKECLMPYHELSEDMKNLDRRFAKEILDLL